MRTSDRHNANRRHSSIAVALALIVAGAVCAFGPALAINLIDDYIARARHADTDRWIAAHVPTKLARSSEGVEAPAIRPDREGYLLEIPRIGVQVVVHVLEPVALTGVNTPTLRRYGAGQVPFTTALRNVSPGEDGTAVVAGHRTTYGAPFRHLDLLKPGDLILLRQGTTVQRWRVETSAVISPTDVGAIRSQPGVRRLVLLACTPPFSARARLMIDARLARRDAANAITGR